MSFAERFGYLLKSKTFLGIVGALATAGEGFVHGAFTLHQAVMIALGGLVALGIRDALEVAKGQGGEVAAVANLLSPEDVTALAQKAVTAVGLHIQIPEEKFPEIVDKAEVMLKEHLKDAGVVV